MGVLISFCKYEYILLLVLWYKTLQIPKVKVSRLVLQFSLSNLLKPGIKSKMKMYLEQSRKAMLQLHLSDQQLNSVLKCILY